MRSEADARRLLRSGADKVGINSAAVERPELIARARPPLRQPVRGALGGRPRRGSGGWEVVTRGGRHATGLDALAWIREGVERGAGEILLTSIDRDGTQGGYDLALIEEVAAAVPVPVIASGGAGRPEHLRQGARRRRRGRARRVDLPSGDVHGGGGQAGDRGGGVPGAGGGGR